MIRFLRWWWNYPAPMLPQEPIPAPAPISPGSWGDLDAQGWGTYDDDHGIMR